jgi:serine/threonine-protein kinase
MAARADTIARQFGRSLLDGQAGARMLGSRPMALVAPSFGRYELVRRLAGGGMGEVWLARALGPERVQKMVVLKRVRPDRSTEEARARFIDEARVAVSLSHPHVVPVFEFGEREGEYYLVMDWVRGGDLARVAGVDRPPLGWASAALAGSELCDALAYVHARTDRRGHGLVHGDVTPRNVLLSPDGHVLLGDFGLARFRPHGSAGTARYLAPEQARGEALDGRADLYALALLLCEAATGAPAFDRDPERARAQARVGVVPPLDGCDPALAAVLRRALAAAPADRYADAGALREAFEALLDREPRARAAGRAELVRRVAAARETEGAAAESTVAPTAATRAATRLSRRSMGWVASAALVLGLVGGAELFHRLGTRTATPTPTFPASAASSAREPSPTTPQASPPPRAEAMRPSAPDTPRPRATAPRLPPRTEPARPRDEPMPTPTPEAMLDVSAAPWAHVRVDGRDVGDTPVLQLGLPAGPHHLELVNEPLGVHREIDLELHPGEHRRQIENLAPR